MCLILAASAFVWLLSVALFVIGLIFCFIKPYRDKGLLMLGGSVCVWFLSMGMCAVAPRTDTATPVRGWKP